MFFCEISQNSRFSSRRTFLKLILISWLIIGARCRDSESPFYFSCVYKFFPVVISLAPRVVYTENVYIPKQSVYWKPHRKRGRPESTWRQDLDKVKQDNGMNCMQQVEAAAQDRRGWQCSVHGIFQDLEYGGGCESAHGGQAIFLLSPWHTAHFKITTKWQIREHSCFPVRALTNS